MTRLEYEYTLHDLLGIGGEIAKHLPPENSSATFDTVAIDQGISPVHIRSYLHAADVAITAGGFEPSHEGCAGYAVSIAAVLGRRYEADGEGVCVELPAADALVVPPESFAWAWHGSTKDDGVGPASITTLAPCGPCEGRFFPTSVLTRLAGEARARFQKIFAILQGAMRPRLTEAIRFHFRQRQALPSASGSNGGAATRQGDFMEHGKLRFLNNSRELQDHCTETRIMLLYKCCRTPDRTAGACGTFMNAKPKMAKSAPRSTQSWPSGVPTRYCRRATCKSARAPTRRADLREMSQFSIEAVGLRYGVILVGSCVNGHHQARYQSLGTSTCAESSGRFFRRGRD